MLRPLQPEAIRQRLKTSLWFWPAIAVLLAIFGVQVLVGIDHHLDQQSGAWYLFAGQPDSARELLSTIASAMLTFTGLVFSITILVLQLASSQFSPRVIRTFLEDRFTRFAMCMFVGSFVFALVLLPEVRDATGQHPAFVPGLSVFVSFLLVLLSVGVFIRYIHDMAHAVRVIHIIQRVAQETRETIDAMYPQGTLKDAPLEHAPSGPPTHQFGHDRPPGVITHIDERELMKLACDRDLVIELVPFIGDFVARGAPLFRVWGSGRIELAELRDHVVFSHERTPHQDPAFGFRQLVDIAERALSPAVNDPTTAVQAMDQLHDLLRTLVVRPFPSPVRADESGRVRLILPRPDWSAYVRLALDEIREYGEGSIQVARRMRALLEDLIAIAPPDRLDILEEQLRLLELAARRGFATEEERRLASRANVQGQGQETDAR